MKDDFYNTAQSIVSQRAAPPLSGDMQSVADLKPFAYTGQRSYSQSENSIFDGGKFDGGFGITQLMNVDYWTLRKRSVQIFTENLYGRGLIRRLIVNEINTGLTPECYPDEAIIGMPEDSLADWSEMVENRFSIWAKNPKLCDFKGKDTFAELQRTIDQEALVRGDVLIVLHIDRVTNLPKIQLISGEAVRSPLAGKVRVGHKVKHGVETDKQGRQVAFWVTQGGGEIKRVPAVGEKSGRRIAWLVYGTDKLMDDVRGQPLLSIVMQSLKEIDRYRDSVQRKAVINSILAMYIKKGEDKMGSLPIQGGAVKRGAVQTDSTDTERKFNVADMVPGVVMEELQQGEEPVGFHNQGTDLAFGDFEASVIQAVAWANNMPPEILTLSFSSNYSASQAATSEFKMFLSLRWSQLGETICSPIYQEWLLAETLTGKINSPGLLAAWRDPKQYDIFGAWVLCDWYGSIKPSIDPVKQAKGSKLLVDGGWSTNAREARGLNGSKFSKNIKRLVKENELKVAAARPLAEFKKEFGETPEESLSTDIEAHVDMIAEAVADRMEVN